MKKDEENSKLNKYLKECEELNSELEKLEYVVQIKENVKKLSQGEIRPLSKLVIGEKLV